MVKTFRCQVVTPQGMVFDRDINSAVLPLVDGEMGILPNHAPLMAVAGSGRMRLKVDGKTFGIEIAHGFIEVRDNVLTVLAERTGAVEEAGSDMFPAGS